MFKRFRKQLYDDDEEEIISGWYESDMESLQYSIRLVLLDEAKKTYTIYIEPDYDIMEYNLILHITVSNDSPLMRQDVTDLSGIIDSLSKYIPGFIFNIKRGPIITLTPKYIDINYWVEVIV